MRITATNTAKVPNASPTAASSGSDLNGMAARIAAGAIKARMIAYAVEEYGVPADHISFRDGIVYVGNTTVPFPELAKKCRQNRVQLSHAGYTRRRRSNGTARPARDGRSFTSPTELPAPKWQSIR